MNEDHFARVPFWVLAELSDDHTALAVYVALAQHRNQRTGCAYPSKGRLAELTGLSERSVQRRLKTLREAGVIIPRLRGGRAVRYYLPLSRTGDTGVSSGETDGALWGDTGVSSGETGVSPKLEERTRKKNSGGPPDRSRRASDAPPPGQRGDALTPLELLYTSFRRRAMKLGIRNEESIKLLWQKELKIRNGSG